MCISFRETQDGFEAVRSPLRSRNPMTEPELLEELPDPEEVPQPATAPTVGNCPSCGSTNTQKLSVLVKSGTLVGRAGGVGLDSGGSGSVSGGLFSARSALAREKSVLPRNPYAKTGDWLLLSAAIPFLWPVFPFVLARWLWLKSPQGEQHLAVIRRAREQKLWLLNHGWTCLRCGHDWVPGVQPTARGQQDQGHEQGALAESDASAFEKEGLVAKATEASKMLSSIIDTGWKTVATHLPSGRKVVRIVLWTVGVLFGLGVVVAILQQAGVIEKPPAREPAPASSGAYTDEIDAYFKAMSNAFKGFGETLSTARDDTTRLAALAVSMRMICGAQSERLVALRPPERYREFHVELLATHARLAGAFNRVDVDYFNDRMVPDWQNISSKYQVLRQLERRNR